MTADRCPTCDQCQECDPCDHGPEDVAALALVATLTAENATLRGALKGSRTARAEAEAERDEANRRAVSIGEKAGRALIEAIAERDEAERGRQQALLAHAVEKQEKHNIETRLRAERDRLAEQLAIAVHEVRKMENPEYRAALEEGHAALAAEPREDARLCEHGHLVFLTSDKCIHGHRAAEPREDPEP